MGPGSAVSIGVSAMVNSVTRVMYQWPEASCRNVADLVVSSTPTGLPDASAADLWNIHFATNDRNPLRYTESRRVVLPALEAWEPGTFLKEVLVCAAQISEHLLQCLRIHVLEPCSLRLLLQHGETPGPLRPRTTCAVLPVAGLQLLPS